MNPIFRKLQASFILHSRALDQAALLLRASVSVQLIQGPLTFANERQYRTMPTHGIGRYKHLIPKEAPKKKKERLQMKPIKMATDTEYGTLNVKVSGYDMILVEHYSQYIHNLCNRLGVKVAESYALPTKTMEVMVMAEQGTKMYIDAILKTHERIVQVMENIVRVMFSDVLKGNNVFSKIFRFKNWSVQIVGQFVKVWLSFPTSWQRNQKL
uniref:Small ribosomal subunit protein uS10 domain-containing protein n=1 Tax=Esox lucius TaxID=8010 RepID=A0AAY5L171_ESOLU